MKSRGKNIVILAIESSCDETAAAVILGNLKSKLPRFQILSSVIKSQIPLHQKFGGVVPEVAARAHVQNILPVVKKALVDAGASLTPNPLALSPVIDYLAVTSGPGLIASLIVGTEFAKGLAYALGKPILPVNHMAGHLYSAFGHLPSIPSLRRPARLWRSGGGNKGVVKFPVIALIVSGGHTMIVLMRDYYNYKVIGSTLDDAAGEAFDKVAKLLGLPYPGGPTISKLAESGKSTINFPRPMLNSKNYDFSFSGLKTAVYYHIRDYPLPSLSLGRDRERLQTTANIARSFEDAVVDVLVSKTLRAAQGHKAKTVTLSGGVAANKKLRDTLMVNCQRLHVKCIVPPARLCTDNAAMIAIAAYFKLKNGFQPVAYSQVKADSSWEI